MTDPSRRRRPFLLLSSSALCALVLALVLAAGASAETRVGEVTSPANASAPPEADLVAASATYESTTGAATMTFTTAAAPGTNGEFLLLGELVTSPGPCSLEEIGPYAFPAIIFRAPYDHPQAEVLAGKEAERETKSGEHTGGLEGLPNAPKTVSGSTTRVTETASQLANRPYNCAIVFVGRQKSGGEGETLKLLTFPLTPKLPEPQTITVTSPPVTTTVTTTVPAPAPLLSPTLAFQKTVPLKPARNRWTTVRFSISDPGTGAVGPVTIKAKAPKGVRLESSSLKLPALLPGQTWPASLRVEVTDAAAPRSSIALTATASGLSARGSVLLKPRG